MKKKFTKIAVLLGLTLSLSVSTFAASFKDVTPNHWAYPGISYMQQQGYMTMNQEGNFLPNEHVDYFAFSELLAKLTGYLDENEHKDMDEALKQSIRANYQKQLPIIQQYDNPQRYSTWDKKANEEIAYLLGRGYLKSDELAKFMIKSADGREYRTTLTKEDLAVLLVRYIGKEATAIQNYKGTGFKDEATIREANRPHVAFLRNAGLINGDAEGNFKPGDRITRALCATMTTNAIRYKESLTPQKPSVPVQVGVLKNIVDNSSAPGELIALVEVDNKANFLNINQATVIKTQKGEVLKVEDLKLNDVVHITLVEGGSKYIATIEVQREGQIQEPEKPSLEDVYEGEVGHIGRHDDLTLETSKGAVTYTLAPTVQVTYKGSTLAKENVKPGDVVRIRVKDNQIVAVEVITFKTENQTQQGLRFVNVVRKLNQYYFTVKEGNQTKQIEVASDVVINRDGKKASIHDLRRGDQLKLTYDQDVVTKVEVDVEKKVIEGTIKEIIIAATSRVIVQTTEGDVTAIITSDTDLYDSETRQDVSLRDIKLGASVELRTESEEALSLIIKKGPSAVTYKGEITYVGPGARYIDVVVEYDRLTGDTMVVKRINVPSSVKIIVDREIGYRNQLREGMEVLITYTYGEELQPEKVEVIRR